MIDFLFFVKTLALTIVFILLMQIEVGHHTIESHAMRWAHDSYVGEVLNGVSRGAAKMVQDVSHQVSGLIHRNVNRNSKEDAHLKKESPFRWTHSAKAGNSNDD